MLFHMKVISKLLLASTLLISGAYTTAQVHRGSVNKNGLPHMVFFDTSIIDEEELLVLHQAKKAGLSYSLIGTGKDYIGFGQKWRFVRDELTKLLHLGEKKMSPDSLVVVADVRDTLLNSPSSDSLGAMDGLIDHVNMAFDSITQGQDDDAVVFGTEFSCCVFALTHAKPDDYFDETATKRVKRSCSSGKEDCEWKGSAKAMPWTQFQMDLARERTGGMDVADTFLNGGLMIGKAASLLKLIDLADLEDTEDDQAVFTGLMYRRPDLVLLDYGNEIFGTARFSLGMEGGGCSFKTVEEGQKNKILLEHTELKSTPFLLHTPNHFFECYDMLASLLGEERSDAMKGLASNSRALMGVDNEDDLPFMKDKKEGGRLLSYGVLTPGTSITEISGGVFNLVAGGPFDVAIGLLVTDTSDNSSASGATSTTDGSFTITKTVDLTTTLDIVLTIPDSLTAQGFTACAFFGSPPSPCSSTFSISALPTGTTAERLAPFTAIILVVGPMDA